MNKEELNKKVEALKEEQSRMALVLKELEEALKVPEIVPQPETWIPESFVPKGGEQFHYLDSDNHAHSLNFESRSINHQYKVNSGNSFKTYSEAERMAEINLEVIEFKRYVKKLNGDWTPNWKDATDKKFIIHYREENKEFLCSSFSYNYYFNVVFNCTDVCFQTIEKYGDKLHYLLRLANG